MRTEDSSLERTQAAALRAGLLALAIGTLYALGGCGQKGPLTLPAAAAAASAPAPAR